MSDLGIQLREYFDATAPPVELDEIITDEVWVTAGNEALRRRVVVAGGSTARAKSGGVAILPGWAYGVAAMVLVLVLTIGLALLMPGADEDKVIDEPTPTTAVRQTPTTTQPEPSPGLSGDSGTLDTALGPIPWIHAAEVGLIPHQGVIQTPSGFAGVTHEEVSDGRYVSRWITSPDGVTWAPAPFPVPLDSQADVRVGETQGPFWLTDGVRLWLSDDEQVWTEIDLAKMAPPPSAGVVWRRSLESPAVSGDLAVFPLLMRPELPLREIFDTGSEFAGEIYRTNCGWAWELEPCQDVADDVDVVYGVDPDTGEETLLARFRLEAGDETAYVVDIDTGSRVHEFSVAGFDGEQLTGISGSDLHWNAVVLVDSHPSATLVETPWSPFGLRSVFIAAVENRLLAYVDSGPPHGATTLDAIEVWESDDGLDWTNRGSVDFGIDATGEVDVMMFQRGNRLIAHITHDLDQSLPSEARLTSTDGLRWEPFPAEAPGGWAEPLGDGFVSLGDGVFLSPDGNRWEELMPFDRRSGTGFVAGDTLIVALENEGAFDTWAFDFEP